jgi:hypothetical protein
MSSIELTQEPQLLMDYNLGIPLDLIDRDIYSDWSKNLSKANGAGNGMPDPSDNGLTEKDRFLLSDAATYLSESAINRKANKPITSKDIKLPSRYQLDKVHQWGIDIRDPLAVRQL